MIEQQYYTRERRGIFRPSEGYDTIAKSRGLSESFIKKYLHPFCFYDPPRSLEASGEKDSAKYPEAFMCFNVETGEMVVGRSVYVSADFTGLRSTFFTHNFVIPGNEKKEYIKNAGRLVFAKGFAGSYDIENGKDIPEIQALEYDKWESPDAAGALRELGITADIYKKLLYAVIMSSAGKKKVYINLGVDIGRLSICARILLNYILNSLPYYIRENTGFITYLKEPESRKYINIMFIEDEGLRAGHSKVEREYVFDIAQGRIQNVDINVESHTYLNFAWNSINNPARMKSFYRFACSMLGGGKQDARLSIDAYDELCILYQIEEGNADIYRINRENVYESVFKFHNYADESGRERLSDIYLKLIDVELEDINRNEYNNEYCPSNGIIKDLVGYFELGVQKINGRILYLILYALYRGRVHDDYAIKIFETVSENNPMYVEFINAVLKNDNIRPIFEGYIKVRLLDINSLDKMFNEIKYWDNISQDVLSNRCFKIFVSERVMELLRESGNIISSGKKIDSFLSRFVEEEKGTLLEEKHREFAAPILREVEDYIYRNMDLESITIDDIKNLSLRVRRNESRYEILEYIYELVHNGYRFDMYNILTKNCKDQIKKIIKRLYENNIEYKNYPNIILGFAGVTGRDRITYDFSGLIEYIMAKGKDEVHKFLLWSFEENVFSSAVNFNDYLDSIKHYFKKYDRSAFKDKEIKKSLYSTESRVFTKLLKEMEFELANPVVKFFIMYKRQMARGVIMLVLISALAFGAFKLYGLLFPGKSSPEPSKEDTLKTDEATEQQPSQRGDKQWSTP